MAKHAGWAVLVAVAVGCGGGDDAGHGDGGPDHGLPALTIGGVGFAGAVSFEEVGAVSSVPPRAIDGLMRHVYAPGSDLRIRFFIPAAVWHGPGTYPCGAEPEKLPADYAYCSLSVEHRTGTGGYALWTTEGAPSGVYGPLGGCSLVVTDDGATEKSGTLSCAPPYATSSGGHPDAGKPLIVSGSWRYRL